MSFVFQHQDSYYWYLIVENVEKIGFEYVGVVKQNNAKASFKKVKNPKVMMRQELGAEIVDIIRNEIEECHRRKRWSYPRRYL